MDYHKNRRHLAAVWPLFLLAIPLLAVAPALVPIHLLWQPSTQADVYNVYGSNDLTGSWSNWPVLMSVTDTNAFYAMTPGQMFFFVTASNFWGESGPSNLTNTPNVATNPAGLIILRK